MTNFIVGTVDGNVIWHSHYEKLYGDSSKTKNKITIWPNNPSSGYLSPKLENINQQRYMHPDVHSNNRSAL